MDFEEQKIELKDFSLKWLRRNYATLADRQAEPYKKDPSLDVKILRLFNLLEEFSLKVKYLGLIDHPALASIRMASIYIIEANSSYLLTYFFVRPNGYPGIKELYLAWQKYGERKSNKELLDEALERVRNEIAFESRLAGSTQPPK